MLNPTNPVTIDAAPPPVLLTQHHPTRPTSFQPGLNPLRSDHTINLNTSYGSSHHLRNTNDIRIFFQNTKGLTYSSIGEDYEYYLSCTKSLGAYIIGMAETNAAWKHYHL